MPSFHSLRFFNLLSMLLCLGFSICAVAGSVISGLAAGAPPKDYSIHGRPVHVMFNIFNAISIMVTAFANPIIVEIQATIVPPATKKVVKGLVFCYTLSLVAFLSVSIAGYWAFGNAVKGIVFDNMRPLVPTWLYILSNALACLQLIVITVVYLQPLFAKYEGLVIDAKKGQFSPRNAFVRILGRSLFVSVAILIAAMVPFFSDFSALMGAFAFIPLCIVLPSIFYLSVFRKASRLSWTYIVNIVIPVVFSIAIIIGIIAALHQIALDIHTYRIFPSS
ncbi:hypothetical protein KP509_05G010300 [Ceratopteris richardii]|uniref:Amino acid transporter transmembrane domain-containing protein n=1 Tax=Ceratopteris richardii TaxID=49495 RepID=A0A8T2UJC8_CERRI|nr:hypothetical protein KP509_05G010300 [Ceratopteris richardii]